MKSIGIQIKSNEVILVVLKKNTDETIIQTDECTKLILDNPSDSNQVRQFRDEINSALDSIKADKIAIMSRNANAKGQMTPAPISFKLEGIIQLYEKKEVQIIPPQTTTAYFKKQEKSISAKRKYQEDAFDVAYYLIHK